MNQRYAGFGVRFVATLIDGILLLVISYPVYYLFSIPYTLLGWFILLNSHFISTTSPHLSDVIILFMYMGLALLPALGLVYSYFVLYQKKYGQTIGKKIMKIKVVTYDDRTPTKSDFFRREIIGKFLSAIILGIGYLQVIWNPKKQALHDKCAKTYVVYTGNRQKKLSKLQLFIIIVFLGFVLFLLTYLLGVNKFISSTFKISQNPDVKKIEISADKQAVLNADTKEEIFTGKCFKEAELSHNKYWIAVSINCNNEKNDRIFFHILPNTPCDAYFTPLNCASVREPGNFEVDGSGKNLAWSEDDKTITYEFIDLYGRLEKRVIDPKTGKILNTK